VASFINEQLKFAVAQPAVFESLQHLARFKIDIFAIIVRRLQSDEEPRCSGTHLQKRFEKSFCLPSQITLCVEFRALYMFIDVEL